MPFGNATFTDAAGAVSDLFAAQADRYKAQGAAFEKQNYDLAATLAQQNAGYTEWTTNVKAQMADRTTQQALGSVTAGEANSGLATSGTAMDLLHESAANGALAKENAITQGNITEAGYEEQAQSYRNMSQAAQVAINADNTAATGADISGVLKGAASIASLFLAPETGGLSLAIGGAAASAVGDAKGIGGLY
jgi:hypothetical protein